MFKRAVKDVNPDNFNEVTGQGSYIYNHILASDLYSNKYLKKFSNNDPIVVFMQKIPGGCRRTP